MSYPENWEGMTPKRQPHSLLQQSVCQALHLAGWFTIPMKAGFGTYKGLADLYAIREGKQVWIEIKVGKDTQSGYQGKFFSNILRHGGRCLVVRCLEDLKSMGMIENIVL